MKYLVLTDNSKIPIDDKSDINCAICYPENITQANEWWGKLTDTTTAKHVSLDSEGNESILYENDSLHFNKIELERNGDSILMRIIFATNLEDEVRRLIDENEYLKDKANAYDVLIEGNLNTVEEI